MKIYYSIILFLIFGSCATDNPYKEAIIGDWQGSSWIIEGSPVKQNVESIKFTFGVDGTYSNVFAGKKKSGIYRIVENKLYTTAKDEIEIMVKINSLSESKLSFDMNRGGQKEELILTKSN